MEDVVVTEQERVLAGGGEMGALMRSWDWSQTPLGPVEGWPPALRTSLSVVLGAPQPLCLYWGPDFVALYNDGYRRLLADAPPTALGASARGPFTEVLEGVLQTQAPASREEPHATFSFSPVRDEHARGVGVFCFASEPAAGGLEERRRLSQQVEAAHVRLANLVQNAPAFVCTLRGADHVFELVNPLYTQMVGVGRALIGLPFREALPESVAQGTLARLDTVYRTGQPFVGRDFHVLVDRQGQGQLEEVFLTFVYQPRRDAHGQVEGIDVFGFEVTEQVLARQRAESLAWLLSESEERQRRVVEASGAGLWELRLVTGRLTLDARAASLFGLESAAPLTLESALANVHPEDRERLTRAIFAALSGEREGRLFELFRTLAREGRPPNWVECRGQRLLGPDGRTVGLAGVQLGITARKQVEAEREQLHTEVEAARSRLSSLIENAPAFVCILNGPRHVFEMINPLYQQLVGVRRDLRGLSVAEALPEVVEQGFITLLDTVYRTGEPFFGRELSIQLDRTGEGRMEEALLNFVYQPRRDARGQVEGIDVFGFEVTEQVRARQRAEALAQQLRESEEQQRRVVEASGAGLWVLDGATGDMTADARMVELMGLPPGRVFTPEVIRECVHPEDREPVTRALTHALEGGGDGLYHMVFRTGGRHGVPERWVESRAQRMSGAGGQGVLLAGAMLDITERKTVELLRARQSRNHAVSARVGQALSRGTTVRGMLQACAEALVEQLKAALVRIWLLHPTQNVLELEASDGLYTQLDGPHGRIPLGHLMIGRIAQERRPHLTNSLQTDAQAGDTEWARREKLVGFAGYPLRVGERLVGVLALFSHRVLAPDTLDAFAQVADSLALGVERLRAEEALRTRVDFEQKLVGIVSHDLRNPLGAILLGTTVLAQRDALDARALKSVLRIQSAAERASRMVKDLLDFTQARLGGGLQIIPHPANLHELTRAVVEEVEAAWPTRQLELEHEGEGQGVWDADRLGQVVQNLVTNAIKYSPEGSLVRVSTRTEGAHASLTVTNTSEPIPADKLASIFEPMQRATAEVDKVGRSVGLGLYIVKSIVKAHGGAISVASTLEAGTTFTVRLPRARP